MLEKYNIQKKSPKDSLDISDHLFKLFKRRRTIREFSLEKPPREIILNALEIANLAPSGANKQPWHFALIENPTLKKQIRDRAELEEFNFYHKRPNKKWVADLKHLHTNETKAFLEEAPYLIAIFHKHFDMDNGNRVGTNYYAKESAGIATGFLLSSLHMSGLSVLTYTPSRMQFLTKLLNRPEEEKTFMVLAVGYPKEGVQVPVISKKTLDQVVDLYS